MAVEREAARARARRTAAAMEAAQRLAAERRRKAPLEDDDQIRAALRSTGEPEEPSLGQKHRLHQKREREQQQQQRSSDEEGAGGGEDEQEERRIVRALADEQPSVFNACTDRKAVPQ